MHTNDYTNEDTPPTATSHRTLIDHIIIDDTGSGDVETFGAPQPGMPDDVRDKSTYSEYDTENDNVQVGELSNPTDYDNTQLVTSESEFKNNVTPQMSSSLITLISNDRVDYADQITSQVTESSTRSKFLPHSAGMVITRSTATSLSSDESKLLEKSTDSQSDESKDPDESGTHQTDESESQASDESQELGESDASHESHVWGESPHTYGDNDHVSLPNVGEETRLTNEPDSIPDYGFNLITDTLMHIATRYPKMESNPESNPMDRSLPPETSPHRYPHKCTCPGKHLKKTLKKVINHLEKITSLLINIT